MFIFRFKVKARWIAAAAVLPVIAAALLLPRCCASHEKILGIQETLQAAGCADGTLVAEDSVVIPEEFGEVYARYNDLQAQAGFDLLPYRGRTVSRRTYALSGAEAAYAVLLIQEDRVIGGHLTNGEYGGEDMPLFDHGTTG